jgi:predicted Zn-dependent protease
VEADAAASSPHWGDAPADTGISVFNTFAPALGEVFATARAGDRLMYGFALHRMTTTYVGTSTGVRLRHDQPTGHVELTGRAPDGSRSAWMGAPTMSFTDVDPRAMDESIATRLKWAERHVDLREGRYETVLPPSAVADLMIYLYWSAGARDAYDGQTVFSRAGGGTKVGDRLSSAPVTLRSDPNAAGLECAPFTVAHASSSTQSVFDNGLGLASTPWIDAGVLTSLVQTRSSATLTGLPVTPEIDNLIMESKGSDATLDAMIAGTDRGLLLTCLWYIREVDPQTLLLTGLTRDGVYVVEHGEVVGAANNFRFNESPVQLLDRIAEAGATQRTLPREWSDYFTRTAMPPLRIGDFNMSSVSQAR